MVQERGFSYPRVRSLLFLAICPGSYERGRLKDSSPAWGDRKVPPPDTPARFLEVRENRGSRIERGSRRSDPIPVLRPNRSDVGAPFVGGPRRFKTDCAGRPEGEIMSDIIY